MYFKRLLAVGIGSVALAAVLSGCSHSDSVPSASSVPPMTQAQIQALANNPKAQPRMREAVQGAGRPN